MSVWLVGLTDPDSVHVTIADNDSSDFVLSGTNATNNKLVISINHNGSPGDCFLSFSIFQLSNPENYTNVGFNVNITPGQVGAPERAVSLNNVGWPNPVRTMYHFEKEMTHVKVYNLEGQLVLEKHHTDKLDFSPLGAGVYLLYTEDNAGKYNSFKVKKN